MKVQEEVERRERELEEERCRQIEYEKQQQLAEERRRLEMERRKQEELDQQEHRLRRKILHKMKMIEEKRGEEQREELRRKVAGCSVKLKSAVAVKKWCSNRQRDNVKLWERSWWWTCRGWFKVVCSATGSTSGLEKACFIYSQTENWCDLRSAWKIGLENRNWK